jgi:hypothetical protein
MTSDDTRSPPDAKWQPTGVGMAPTFRCALCSKPRSPTGRKLQRVQGVRQWVCKYCVKDAK